MEFETVRIEPTTLGVAWVLINRPEALNALNTKTLFELKSALTQVSSDSSVRVVILSGAGEKAFIAGADIAEMKEKSATEATQFSQLGHEVARILSAMQKPTIAAVNGFALGGGTEMAIACDFIVASDTAVFGQPEVGLGVIPGFGGTFRLAHFIGWPRAKELIYTGRRINAAEAHAMGLVNHVYPKASFKEKVNELAATISKHSLSAVSKAKSLMNELAENPGITFKVDAESHAFGRLFSSYDQKEGMTAFMEKRKPLFEGAQSG